MIKYLKTSIFTSPAHALVNPVTVGVMSKGLAKQFKEDYPYMFDAYKAACRNNRIRPGTLHVYTLTSNSRIIIDFATKKHWRNPSKLEYIESGLLTFVNKYHTIPIESVAFPKLGCGYGGLDWESQVKPLMEKLLNPLPIKVYVHI